MQFGWNPRDTSARIRWVAKIAAIVFLAIYAVIYLKEPFSDAWDNILANLLLVIAAFFTASVATMNWLRYEPTETPRHIWRYFAIGLWLWTAAELIWGYLNITQGEVNEGIADVFWIIAYIFFAQALFIQYRLLANPNKRELLSRVSFAILSLLVLYFLTYRVLAAGADAQGRFSAAINSFYPVADLFLALVALWLVYHFQGGAFSRPWLGLLPFCFTDLLYAWIVTSNMYAWDVDQTNLWSSLFDIAYVGAYLVLGLGILSQWAFLKYGLLSPASEQ